MKKNIISILALVLAVLSLVLSVICFMVVREEPTFDPDRLLALEQENQELRSRIDALEARSDALTTQQDMSGLAGWTLDARAWADSTGADITLTAAPSAYQEGMTASLLVLLEGQEILRLPCQWDGSAFTASGALTAADGYGYYCLLTGPNGTGQQIALTTPENPVQDIPVYLASSLTAYCNLLVDSWEEQEGLLVLTAAYAQTQLPRLSAGGEAAIESAQLVLTLNGSEAARTRVALEPGETAGSFESALIDIRLSIPELTVDDCLDLRLEVTLTDGRQLTAYGASWYRTEDGLYAVVG